jgi:RHS repeat-associated protein
VVEDLKFISDPLLFGRHIAELNAGDNALVRTYVWGLDLSGTEQGAGGVGGLLWLTSFQLPASSSTYFAAYDGNGNVAALLHAPSSMPHARYEYGPLAEPIRLTGPAAALNPLRFSTKRADPTTELVLYEYRAYSPTLGRWLSRDPIGERQRWNGKAETLYSFCSNDGVTSWDNLGLWLGGDHRSLTSASFWAAWRVFGTGRTSPCRAKRLLSVITDANLGTDKGADAKDLKKHFNRGLDEDIDLARLAASEYVCTAAFEYWQLLQDAPGKAECVEGLKKLGTLSHTWQDCYAHMIGLNSPLLGDPGPIEGDPYVPSENLKPASWGGVWPPSQWGEHGPDEPASRETDWGANRRQRAPAFATEQFGALLELWLEKCRCYCAKNWP